MPLVCELVHICNMCTHAPLPHTLAPPPLHTRMHVYETLPCAEYNKDNPASQSPSPASSQTPTPHAFIPPPPILPSRGPSRHTQIHVQETLPCA